MTKTIFTETYVTTEYETLLQHDLQPTNRAKTKKELIESIAFTQGNQFSPIIVSEKTGQIIDGHNTLKACMMAKVPVYYIKVDVEDEAKLIVLLNSSNTGWSTANYINHHGLRDVNYVKLEEFVKRKGAGSHIITLFADGLDIPMIRKGVDISHLDYDYLEDIRRLIIYVAGKFDLKITVTQRGIKKFMKEVQKHDINKLKDNIEKAYLRGDYDNLAFITLPDKLCDLLIKTYKARF